MQGTVSAHAVGCLRTIWWTAVDRKTLSGDLDIARHLTAIERLTKETPRALETFIRKFRKDFIPWEKEGVFDSRCGSALILMDVVSGCGPYPPWAKDLVDTM